MTSGERLTALPIPKGVRITTSIAAYNRYLCFNVAIMNSTHPRFFAGRNKELFGEDSHNFDPDRWLDSRVKKSSAVGIVGNLYVSF